MDITSRKLPRSMKLLARCTGGAGLRSIKLELVEHELGRGWQQSTQLDQDKPFLAVTSLRSRGRSV
jgi:hypothetical protein